MIRITLVAIFLANLALATTTRVQSNEFANADDTARFLAGMQPSANSPLARLTEDSSSRQHASIFDTAFGNFERQQLAKIREWSSANLNAPRPMMYYLFGGPDFLYADAFFPNASTYVLSGLEPVGQVPDLTKLPRWTVAQALRNIEVSLRSVLSVSYFITVNMRQDLNAGSVIGTLPILYVFLARSGKVIRDVSLVNIDEQGVLQTGDARGARIAARGVKILFTGNDGRTKALYYFSTSLSDEPKGIAFLQFCKQQSRGDSFIKSASYLLHRTGFSQTRDFLLDHSELVLQDDSGIPVSYFEAGKWLLQPFGRYVGTLNIFQEHYQPRLTEFYNRKQPNPMGFGIGYQSRFNDSNLLLAIRNRGAPDLTNAGLKDAVPRLLEFDKSGILREPRIPANSSASEHEDKEIY